jgi:phage-related protein
MNFVYLLLLLYSCRAISGSNGGGLYLGNNVLYINFENTNFTNNMASRTGMDIYALNPDAFQSEEGQASLRNVFTDGNNTLSIAGNVSKVKIPLYPGLEVVC